MDNESLARTIAKARHGTDAMWANYMGAAEAAQREIVGQIRGLKGAFDAGISGYPDRSEVWDLAIGAAVDAISGA